jgi:hypothetical protein
MHLIRSSFVNLWWKARRAYDEGLTVVLGTDELHVTGDWRGVFPEGRGVTEVKVKDTDTVGTEAGPAVDDAQRRCVPGCCQCCVSLSANQSATSDVRS